MVLIFKLPSLLCVVVPILIGADILFSPGLFGEATQSAKIDLQVNDKPIAKVIITRIELYNFIFFLYVIIESEIHFIKNFKLI